MRNGWRRPSYSLAVVAAAALVSGCGDAATGPGDLTLARAERIAPLLGAMAFAVANGPQGRSFFDNALPCVRRGVVNYANTTGGRTVTFAGCDLGGGLVVDGTGELRWGAVLPAQDREPLCGFGVPPSCAETVTWTGSLQVSLDGTTNVLVETFTLSDIVVSSGVDTAALESFRMALGAADVPVADGAAVLAGVFDAGGLAMESIANPGGSVDALTDVDLRRLALHLARDLAFFLFDETLEAGRGDHTHDGPCGTSVVTIDPDLLPHVTNTWSDCPDQGLFLGGTFTLEWGRWELSGYQLGTIRMDATGDFQVGGGVPTVALTELMWTVAATTAGSLEELRIILEVRGVGGTRSLTLVVPADD